MGSVAAFGPTGPAGPVRGARRVADALRHLRATGAPAGVFAAYLAGKAAAGRRNAPYLARQREFRRLATTLRLTDDWFTYAIPHWLSVFDEQGLAARGRLEALEIGSWEGLSSRFILHALPEARLTCVDTWEGADEHKSGAAATPETLGQVERAFDANLAACRDRLTKHKGTSLSFFAAHPASDAYDLVYVDGSHHCDDVLVDAIRCLAMLKVGGILIFDDYLWRWYPDATDNPAGPINAFLRLKARSVQVLRVYDQLILRKICGRG